MNCMKIPGAAALFFTAALLLAAGCVSTGNNGRTLIDIIKHFDNSGLRAEQIQPSLFEAIRAQDGCLLKINGMDIEIYKFDTSKEDIRLKLKEIKEKGYMNILFLKVPAMVNGSFVMIKYKDHPDCAKLVKAFSDF